MMLNRDILRQIATATNWTYRTYSKKSRYFFCFYFCLFYLTLSLQASTSPGKPLPIDAGVQEALRKAFNEVTFDDSVEFPWIDADNANTTDLPFSLTALDDSNPLDDLRRQFNASGAEEQELQKGRGIMQTLIESGNFVENSLNEQRRKLPLGLRRNIGGYEVVLAIANMHLFPTHSEVDVILSVLIPGTAEPLLLGASNVGFSFQGGFTGDLRLELLADYGVDIVGGKSKLLFFRSRSGNNTNQTAGTYAIVNCGGVEELGISAGLVLSRDWVKPIRNGELVTDSLITAMNTSTNGSVDTTGINRGLLAQRVHWMFALTAGEQGFYIQTGSRDTFAVNGYEDFRIYAQDITLDYSDTRNPSNCIFPEEYNSPFVNDGIAAANWKGIYIGGIAIGLPSGIDNSDRAPITVFGRSIIIDDRGFTAELGVMNLLSLEQGNVGGWAFSVDSLKFHILQNQFQAVELAGLVHVPLLAKSEEAVSDENSTASNAPSREDCVGYVAGIFPGNVYQFVAISQTNYRINVWQSSVTIRPGSEVGLLLEDDQLSAYARLSGAINVDLQVGQNFGFIADSIGFEDLHLSTDGGLVSLGRWNPPTSISARLGAFGVDFTGINLTETPQGSDTTMLNLFFNARVSLASDNIDLAATGSFAIEGGYYVEENRQRFDYKRFKVNAFGIDCSTESFAVAATIALYRDDATFGTGFYGRGSLRVGTAENGFTVTAVAQFGKQTDAGGEYRYFFVDALALVAPPIPFGGALSVHGFRGGVYYNVSPAGAPRQTFSEGITDSVSQVQANISAALEQGRPSALSQFVGRSLSGQRYLPNQGSFRLEAGVVLGLSVNPEMVNINANLFYEYYNGSGGYTAGIIGNATFYDEVNLSNTPSDNGLSAFFQITMSNGANGFTFLAAADFFVYSDFVVATLSGSNDDREGIQTTDNRMYPVDASNYAGGISFYSSPNEFSVDIGNPNLGMRYQILPPLSLDFSVTAYFSMGTDIRPMPPLPAYVAEFTGGVERFMRNESQYASGRGVAFGANLKLDMYVDLAILYVDILIDLGFDINFQQYRNTICQETGMPLGVKGWYASGQAWAYLSGTVGMDFRIPIIGRVRLEILHAAFGAVLQLKAPNPVYATGALAGEYRLLNGLVRGGFNFRFTAGRECTIISSNGEDFMAGLQTVNLVVPANQSTEVATDQPIQIFLNYPLSPTPVDIMEEEYRLEATGFSVIGPDGPVAGEIIRSEDGYSLTFQPADILAGNAEYEINLTVNLRQTSNSTIVNDTVIAVTFQTGEAYAFIPPSNVKWSYPVDGQFNFYREETNYGYVQLAQGQPDLFEDEAWAIFTDSEGGQKIRRVTYNTENREIRFSMPSLSSNRQYELIIGRTDAPPVGGEAEQGGGGGDNLNQGGSSGGPHSPEWRYNYQDQLPDTFAQAKESSITDTLMVLYFRTSEYRKFEDKVNAQFEGRTFLGMSGTRAEQEGRSLLSIALGNDEERYGTIELVGNSQVDPLMRINGTTDCDWYRDFEFDRLLYDRIPTTFDGVHFPSPRDGFGQEEAPIDVNYIFSDTSITKIISHESWTNGTIGHTEGLEDILNFDFPESTVNEVSFHQSLIMNNASHFLRNRGTSLDVLEVMRNPEYWTLYNQREIGNMYCTMGLPPTTPPPGEGESNPPPVIGDMVPESTACNLLGSPRCSSAPPVVLVDGAYEVDFTFGSAFGMILRSCGNQIGDNDCRYCPSMDNFSMADVIDPWLGQLYYWDSTTGTMPSNNSIETYSGYQFPVHFSYHLPGKEEANTTVIIEIGVE